MFINTIRKHITHIYVLWEKIKLNEIEVLWKSCQRIKYVSKAL